MTDTGALTRPDRPSEGRESTSPRPTAEWIRLGLNVLGPLITLALAIAVDLISRRGGLAFNPIPLLLVSIVFAALCGGLPSSLVSALVTVLYSAHYYSGRGQQLAYGPEQALSLAAVALSAPLAALLVVRGAAIAGWSAPPRRRRGNGERPLLAEVATRLSLTTEVEATLQSVARALVPGLGDCCLIQLLQPDGRLRCAGSAHRLPRQELLTRTLCEQEWPHVQHRGSGPDVVTLTDDRLGPATALLIPLAAGSMGEGRLVLVREGNAGFTPDEVSEAAELGTRVGLEVGCARLLRERAELEARAGLLFDANPEPMWIFDVDTLAFLDLNESALRRYGYERDEMLRLTIMDLHPAAEPAQAAPSPTAERPGVARARHQRRDGTLLDVELTSHELTYQGRNARLVLARDVTDRARTTAALHESEDQLRKAQRSEAIGVLAAGIAHDFNDLLTTIHGYSELLAQDYPADDHRRKDLEEIRRAALRGSLLIRQLLGFGARGATAPRAVDPNVAIRDLSLLIERLVGAETRLAIVLAPDPGFVWIEPRQLEQVLVNLVLHARAALPVGGELVIETSLRQLGTTVQRRGAKPGRYVAITVTCNGTLAEGPLPEGTALGLSIAYGIVREAGGVLRVLTEPGEGTMLRVYLPRIETPLEDEPTADVMSHGETVLVVEDEEGVRELVRRVLARHGYEVLEARHGRDALLEAEHHAKIDLLLTDVVMPEMGGVPLATALRGRRPDLRVLYMSGYTEEEIVRRGEAGEEGGLPLLQKPFTGDVLARAVREMLDTGRANAPAAPDSSANPP
jgi:two-component system cell cycle sensor histidine kinase/response regulator CckA